MTTDSVYPEHDKLSNISDQSQAIGDFLEWAGHKGWMLMHETDIGDVRPCPDSIFGRDCDGTCPKCEGSQVVEVTRRDWMLAPGSTEDQLAEFFGIDRDKLEAEKRQMLASIRPNH